MTAGQAKNQTNKMTRRSFLKLSGLTAASSVLAACGASPTSEPTSAPIQTAAVPTATQTPLPTETETPLPTNTPLPQPVLRIAHISDMHIDLSQKAEEWFNRAMRNIATHSPAFDFVMNTGDCVMDAMFADRKSAQDQWDVFLKVTAKLQLPFFHAIGNHDVWGWGLADDRKKEIESDPLFGKGLAVQQLQMPNRYYSFDRGGWHFIVLDSTHLADQSFFQPYTGKLDEEQYIWLENELQQTPSTTPICIASHIPILAVNGLLDGNNEKTGDWILPGAWTHIDARRLWKLFYQHPNVKICLSGHSHQVEDLKYHGVNYLNDGAISGNWWNGAYMDFPPGYTSLALYPDGSVETEFIEY